MTQQTYIAMKTHITDQLARGRTTVSVFPHEFPFCDEHDVRCALAEIYEAGVQWPTRR